MRNEIREQGIAPNIVMRKGGHVVNVVTQALRGAECDVECVSVSDPGPVEVDILARRHLANIGVTAHRRPYLGFELPSRNIIAKK